MALVFEILDDIIMDYESGDPERQTYGKIRLEALYRYTQEKLQNKRTKNGSMDYYTTMYYGYKRIINRLYDGDIKAAIEMMRELQDDLHRPDFLVYDYDKNYTQAWHRFEDWKVKSLYEHTV